MWIRAKESLRVNQPGFRMVCGPRRRSHHLGRLHRQHHFIDNHHSRTCAACSVQPDSGHHPEEENKKRQKILPPPPKGTEGLQHRPGGEKLFLENEKREKTPGKLCVLTQPCWLDSHGCVLASLTPWMKDRSTQLVLSKYWLNNEWMNE